MRALVAFAAVEIRLRWTVLVAALLAGLLALAVPLFTSLGRHDVREARILMALIFAAAFAFGVAGFVGAETITRELTERRHGFLFARPVPAWAIWGGKVTACWLLALASGALALLPAAAASPGVHLLGSVSPWPDAAATLGFAALATLTLIGWAHAVALMVRSRSPWLLALDAALAVVVAVPVALALRSLYLALAVSAMTAAGIVVAAAVVAAPLVAGALQVGRGRTDIRRGHVVLSATLWGILGFIALSVSAYAVWLRSLSVGDLERITSIVCAERGDWAFVTGEGRGRGDYQTSFLVNVETGRSLEIGPAGRWWPATTFSPDGRRAVWLSPPWTVTDTVRTLMTVDLADPGSGPKATTITTVAGWLNILALSPDGGRVVIGDRGVVSVSELASGSIVASVREPDALGAVRAAWTSNDTVRLLAWNPVPANAETAAIHLYELDVSKRKLVETGQVDGVSRRGFWFMAFDPARDRLLTRTGSVAAGVVVLADGRTGARLATLAPCDGTSLFRAMFLSDGRIAVTSVDRGEATLRLLSGTGVPERTFALGPGQTANLGAQPDRGTVIVTTRLRRDDLTRGANRSLVVNLETGSLMPLGSGVRPLAWYPWREGVVVPEPGSFASRAVVGADGRLAMLDPGSGTLRPVLRARLFSE